MNAAAKVLSLGIIYAPIMLKAFKQGLDIEKFHVVAHGLGAQLAGVMGRKIISNSHQSQKLKRITGLDPANTPFFPGSIVKHLSHSDAEMVDLIHTDAGIYGQPIATGTVDFWPNDGKTLQPEYGLVFLTVNCHAQYRWHNEDDFHTSALAASKCRCEW
ncbi:hypothetical protein HA402_006316 [Bradysia odoriphaga]|nr:hypothetical protein HA402_006316 [Bradysia odoriphaga]